MNKSANQLEMFGATKPASSSVATSCSESGAVFSACRSYRYSLWRNWGEGGRVLAYIGVNPSDASEHKDDNTIRSCCRIAKHQGFDGILMLNAFCHIQTKLGKLKLGLDHVGPYGDETLLLHRDKGAVMVAAWGNHCPCWREDQIIELLGRDLKCLGRNKLRKKTNRRSPKHPLFLKATTPLEDFSI